MTHNHIDLYIKIIFAQIQIYVTVSMEYLHDVIPCIYFMMLWNYVGRPYGQTGGGGGGGGGGAPDTWIDGKETL